MRATAVRERPILFSGEMVRAILDGRKTQTRRVVKFPRWTDDLELEIDDVILNNGTRLPWPHATYRSTGCLTAIGCPFGDVGDRLWVRETFAIECCQEVGWYEPPFDDGRPLQVTEDEEYGRWWQQCHYKASDPTPSLACEHERCAERNCGECMRVWRPSIFMPRWASRIMLEVVGVRVEQLEDISEDDAIAEGRFNEREHDGTFPSHIFRQGWDSLNAKRGYGWNVNPWVWVIEFRRVA